MPESGRDANCHPRCRQIPDSDRNRPADRVDDVVTLLTYSTVLFQLAFPLLLLHRRLRLPAVLAAVALHTGIALMMGLPTFSLVMVSMDFVVFGDAHYRRVGAAVRRAAARAVRAAREGAHPPVQDDPAWSSASPRSAR